MGTKIKANDDRIQEAAIAALLISRDRMAQAQAGGLVADALANFREDLEGYKAHYPERTWAAARDGSSLTNNARRKRYLKLVNAMDALLARIKRKKTSFNSLADLDHFLSFNLRDY